MLSSGKPTLILCHFTLFFLLLISPSSPSSLSSSSAAAAAAAAAVAAAAAAAAGCAIATGCAITASALYKDVDGFLSLGSCLWNFDASKLMFVLSFLE